MEFSTSKLKNQDKVVDHFRIIVKLNQKQVGQSPSDRDEIQTVKLLMKRGFAWSLSRLNWLGALRETRGNTLPVIVCLDWHVQKNVDFSEYYSNSKTNIRTH